MQMKFMGRRFSTRCELSFQKEIGDLLNVMV